MVHVYVTQSLLTDSPQVTQPSAQPHSPVSAANTKLTVAQEPALGFLQTL